MNQLHAKYKTGIGSIKKFSPKALVYVLLAALAIVGAVGSIYSCDSSAEQRRIADNAAARKRADSLAVARLMATANRTRSQTMVLDELLHQSTRPEDASIHLLAIDAALDSASALLTQRPRTVTAVNDARTLLSRLRAPLAPRQESRIRQLQSLEQTARVEVTRQAQRAAAESRRQLERATTQNRRSFAGTLEGNYLREGMDVTVRATGTNATTLRLTWILVSRPMAYQLSENGELFATLRAQGFRRFEISDGYDKMWYWKLD